MHSDQLIFADEDPSREKPEKHIQNGYWKLLIVDDESDVHEITRITLRGYTFEEKAVKIFSAYNEKDVKRILNEEPDIALIFLDVVMEEDDTGLKIVEYIRHHLGNTTVRIVLRTGQPGKAPEQEVIVKYDINDYKTKPELTAQKLYTSVTACLRAYKNLVDIESHNRGLENIIDSIADVYKNQSFSSFGKNVLVQLGNIAGHDFRAGSDCAYFVQMPHSHITMAAGTGKFEAKTGEPYQCVVPQAVVQAVDRLIEKGGESLIDNSYVGVFKTKEGFLSLLYIEAYHTFSEFQKRMIRLYAGTIALGLDNIRLTREIINTQKEVILTLGEIVESRSQETANHVARVAEICHLLAKKCSLDEETCEMIRLASPMHDVGKIGIQEAILNKPGKLTSEEFEAVKTHTVIGFNILNKSNRPIMKAAAIIALQHHEKWDGTGYPNGLSGENIHLFGRIVAVADVFDALCHQRCYKEAWPMEKVVSLFEQESGLHFDPDLVRILLDNLEEFTAINRLFPE